MKVVLCTGPKDYFPFKYFSKFAVFTKKSSKLSDHVFAEAIEGYTQSMFCH